MKSEAIKGELSTKTNNAPLQLDTKSKYAIAAFLVVGVASVVILSLGSAQVFGNAGSINFVATVTTGGVGVLVSAGVITIIVLKKRTSLSVGDLLWVGYNRGRLWLLPKAATPLIIIGVVSTILGTLGLITALTHFQIPGIEFIATHIPASVVLSLVMMRAGIHTINSGVLQARKMSRWRQEAMILFQLAYLQEDAAVKAQMLDDLKYRDLCMPPKFRVGSALGKNGIYGKEVGDILNPAKPTPKGISDLWYDFWLDKQKFLGGLDVFVGQLMLIAAISAVVFLCVGTNSLPSSLAAFAKDKYLSCSFSAFLFANWLDCTKRGLRMRGFKKREMKRAELERDLQLINFNKAVNPLSFEKIRRLHCPTPRITEVKDNKKTNLISLLAYPKILFGGLITLLGMLYLVQSWTSIIPTELNFLTANSSVSTLFSITLITTGFFTLYQGIGVRDKKQKRDWKKSNEQARNLLINKLYHSKTEEIKLLKIKKPESTKSIKAFTWMAYPGYILGGLAILSGIIGLFALGGYPISSALSFITKDPELTAFFCVSMGLFGAAAISDADRMRSYQARKEEDYMGLQLLRKAVRAKQL